MKKNNFIFGSIIALLAIIIALLFFIMNENTSILYLYLFVILYLVITIIFLFVEQKNIINVKTIFVAIFSAMIGLAPLFYYLNKKTDISNIGNSIVYQYPMIILGYISMLIGFYIFPKAKSKKKKKEVSVKKDLLFFKLLLYISMFFNILYIFLNKSSFLGGNLESGRITALAGNGIILVLTSLYLPGIGGLYNYVCKYNKQKKMFYFFVLINILFYIIRGSRTSIIRMFILIFMIRNYHKPVPPRKLLTVGAAALFAITGLQILRTSMSNEQASFLKTFYEQMQVGSINLNYIYNIFPSEYNYQLGYTFLINLIMLLPGEGIDFTLWLKEKIGISFAGGGVTPTIIGEGYINFGYIGVILIMLIVGIIGKKLNDSYFDKNSNIIWTSYLIIIFVGVFKGGIANEIVSLLTIGFLHLCYNIYNQKKN